MIRNQLSVQLGLLKQDIIGIVKSTNRIEMLLEYHNNTDDDTTHINTVYITQFLAIHRYSGRLNSNQLIHIFPDNKSLQDLISKPFEWNEYCKQHNI